MFQLKHLIGILTLGLASADHCREPLLVGQTFITGDVDPTQGSNPWALISHGVAEKLFTVNKSGEIVGQLAESVSKISDTEWDVTIKIGRKFSDGTLADATHVAASLNEQNEKNDDARASLGSITATASDDRVVKIQSERPTHIMKSVLAEWVFVIYTRDANKKIVFTGPYSIAHFEPNDHLDLVPNEHYPNADERPSIEVKKFADGHALAEGVKKNKVDIGFHLPIDKLPELRKVENVKIRSFEVGYHYMAFYNLDTMQDVLVRKAIDRAIDRTVLSQALAGGHPTRSLFPDNSPYFTDDSDAHGDKSASEKLLTDAGWELSGGKRVKDGQALTVRLVAYPHRPGLVIMQPLIADALRDLGITVKTTLTGDDWSETKKIMEERTFDMLMWAQHTLPAGDPAWFLNAFFGSEGGNNHANFASTEVDSLLDQLSVTSDHDERVFLSGRVQSEIHNEVPVSNLVTPLWHISINDCVADYEPYGSDYYVIRADLRANLSASSKVQTTVGAMVAMIGGLFMLW